MRQNQDMSNSCPLEITIFTQKPHAEVCASFAVRGDDERCTGSADGRVTLSFPSGIRQFTTITLPSSEEAGAQWDRAFVHAGGLFAGQKECTSSSCYSDRFEDELEKRFTLKMDDILKLKFYPDVLRGLPLDIDAISVMNVVCQVRYTILLGGG